MPFIVKSHGYPKSPLRALEDAERAAKKRTANKLRQREAKKNAKPPRAKGGTTTRKSKP